MTRFLHKVSLLFILTLFCFGTCRALAEEASSSAAETLIVSGDAKLEQGLYDEAAAEYEKAMEVGTGKEVRKAQKRLRKARNGKARDLYKQGLKEYNKGALDASVFYFQEALHYDPKLSPAKKYLNRAKNEKKEKGTKDIRSGSDEKKDEQEGKDRKKKKKEQKFGQAKAAFNEGRTLYYQGKYMQARERFAEALTLNPYYVPASRYMEAVIAYHQDVADSKAVISMDSSMVEVTETWLPPEKKKLVEAPKEAWKETTISEAKIKLLEQANQVIPAINFNNAHLSDVIKYLSGISGINIVIDESVFDTVAVIAYEPEVQSVARESLEEGEEGGEEGEVYQTVPTPVSAAGRSDRVTISLKNIPLLEALKYILRAKGLKYIVEDFAVLIVSANYVPPEDYETRYYHLASGVGTFTTFEMGEGGLGEDDEGEGGEAETITIKDILQQSGVPWPKGSKIFLDSRTGTLIVRNTPTNLAIVEDILRTLDVTPFQVSILARFVELSMIEATDLGLEWILNDDWKLLLHEGQSGGLIPPAAKQRIQIDKMTNVAGATVGATRNLRWFSTDTSGVVQSNQTGSPNPIFRVSGILTRPEFSVVLHALAQKGNDNVLSAPRVTTINGQRAQIEVVQEYIYPTEFEVTPATTNSQGNVITPPVVAPGSFETRDIGIILDVTPNVGGDRKTINLTIMPEVSELVNWLNYGVSTVNFSYPILQPLFATRTVTTSVIVNDGETVVLGGMIRESAVTFDDKIPFLGDIPLLGYLFRKKSSRSEKRSLIIFVTADLLTPSGEPFQAT